MSDLTRISLRTNQRNTTSKDALVHDANDFISGAPVHAVKTRLDAFKNLKPESAGMSELSQLRPDAQHFIPGRPLHDDKRRLVSNAAIDSSLLVAQIPCSMQPGTHSFMFNQPVDVERPSFHTPAERSTTCLTHTRDQSCVGCSPAVTGRTHPSPKICSQEFGFTSTYVEYYMPEVSTKSASAALTSQAAKGFASTLADQQVIQHYPTSTPDPLESFEEVVSFEENASPTTNNVWDCAITNGTSPGTFFTQFEEHSDFPGEVSFTPRDRSLCLSEVETLIEEDLGLHAARIVSSHQLASCNDGQYEPGSDDMLALCSQNKIQGAILPPLEIVSGKPIFEAKDRPVFSQTRASRQILLPSMKGFGPSLTELHLGRLRKVTPGSDAYIPYKEPSKFHHRGFLGHAVPHPTSTSPSLSFAVIHAQQKPWLSEAARMIDMRRHALTVEAYKLIDPIIVYDRSLGVDVRPMWLMSCEASNKTKKFYTIAGTWNNDELENEDDMPQFDTGRTEDHPRSVCIVNGYNSDEGQASAESVLSSSRRYCNELIDEMCNRARERISDRIEDYLESGYLARWHPSSPLCHLSHTPEDLVAAD